MFVQEDRKSNASRHPFVPVFMVRIFFPQRRYGFGDRRIAYPIKDRPNFPEFMERSMMDLAFRGVGMARAKANIAMTNLAYNICGLARTKAYHAGWIGVK